MSALRQRLPYLYKSPVFTEPSDAAVLAWYSGPEAPFVYGGADASYYATPELFDAITAYSAPEWALFGAPARREADWLRYIDALASYIPPQPFALRLVGRSITRPKAAPAQHLRMAGDTASELAMRSEGRRATARLKISAGNVYMAEALALLKNDPAPPNLDDQLQMMNVNQKLLSELARRK